MPPVRCHRGGGRMRPLRAVAGLVAVVVIVALATAAAPAPSGAAGAAAAGDPPATATVPTPPSSGPSAGHAVGLTTPAVPVADCPWLAEAMAAGDPPAELAQLTEQRMTLDEKLGRAHPRGPRATTRTWTAAWRGCASLRSPSPTVRGAWPSATPASPCCRIRWPSGPRSAPRRPCEYGDLIGSEAAGQGIDVSQGPNLNIDRVPTSGRADESYGEDPLLTTVLGTADIEGLQARGVMAEAKHLAVYNQETNRGALDDEVPTRALQELYLPPFKAAVTQAHVATLMCAYPRLDGTFQCEDPGARSHARAVGLRGFRPFRPRGGPRRAGRSGLRGRTAEARRQGRARGWTSPTRRLSLATVDDDVDRVLTEMFAFGVIGRPATGTPGTPVDPPRPRPVRPHHRRAVGGPAQERVRPPAAVGPPRRLGGRDRGRRLHPPGDRRASGRPTSSPRSRRPLWPASPRPGRQGEGALRRGWVDDPAPPDGAHRAT